ncbi:MAG TPA: recombinase family protein [Phycisphaerae bacterium]|nr:recombinase family protein [Phycisphaerae bacterium]
MADAAYARYSSHKQDEGCSIEVQLEACHRAAGGKCADYVDRATTGRSNARASLLRLLDDAAAGKFSRVFLYKWDRLGRNAETHLVVSQLEDSGCEVISCTEGRDFLARGVGLVVAENYSRALGQRVRDAHLMRFEAEHTWRGGPPPYGYKLVDAGNGRSKLAVDKDEARVVQEIFKFYLSESIGSKAIAIRLQKRGIATRRGRPWSFITIANSILPNETYTGRIVYNKYRYRVDRRTGKGTRILNGPDEQKVYVEGGLRIISDECFAKAQRRRKERSKSNPRPNGQTRALTGLLYCGCCGNVFYSQASAQNGKRYKYLMCGRRQRYGTHICENTSYLNEQTILDHITRAMMAVLKDDLESVVQDAVKEAQKLLNEGETESQQVKANLVKADKEIARLMRLLRDPDLDESPAAKKAVIRQLGEAEANRDRLNARLGELLDGANHNTGQLLRAVRKALAEAEETLMNIRTATQMNQFVAEFVGRMNVDKDGNLSRLEPDDDGPDLVTGYVACPLPKGGSVWSIGRRRCRGRPRRACRRPRRGPLGTSRRCTSQGRRPAPGRTPPTGPPAPASRRPPRRAGRNRPSARHTAAVFA